MKLKVIIISILALIVLISAFNPHRIVGLYKDYFGGEIKIMDDSTYHYNYHFDLMYSWTSGKWEKIDNTIVLVPITIYDTLRYKDIKRDNQVDTLVKSMDEKPEVITKEKYELNLTCSGQQDLYPSPLKLIYKNERLYLVNKHGKIVRKKQKGIWTKKKFPTYFRKVE